GSSVPPPPPVVLPEPVVLSSLSQPRPTRAPSTTTDNPKTLRFEKAIAAIERGWNVLSSCPHQVAPLSTTVTTKLSNVTPIPPTEPLPGNAAAADPELPRGGRPQGRGALGDERPLDAPFTGACAARSGALPPGRRCSRRSRWRRS